MLFIVYRIDQEDGKIRFLNLNKKELAILDESAILEYSEANALYFPRKEVYSLASIKELILLKPEVITLLLQRQ